MAELDPQALPGSSRVLRHGLDQLRSLGFRSPQASENHGRERRDAGPCRLRDRITLRDQRSSRRKIAAPRRNCPQGVNIEHKLAEQPRLAGGLDLPEDKGLPAFHVPQHARA